MNSLLNIFRYFTGGVFVFSGFVKLIDPVGTQIKMEEYFEVFAEAFHPFFHEFIPFALPIAVAMCVLEVVLGVALLISYKIPVTSTLLLLLVIYFGFLTFYSAYYNKVTDCGCFGDFLKLKPWHSFIKDVVLFVPLVFIYIYRKKIKSNLRPGFAHFFMGIVTFTSVYIAYHAINHLPMIDFRAYKVGAHIPSLMKPSGELIYEYTMEKDGKRFKMTEYPTDTTYKFISMDIKNPEVLPKIKDFSVWNEDGDYTQEVLKGNKLIIIVLNADKARRKDFANIVKLVDSSNKLDAIKIETLVLTSSSGEAFERLRHDVQLAAPYYYADGVVLKTIMRSNPGVWLLKNGTVMGKWHYNDTPHIDEVIEKLRN
jgi:uncharacterized membrane protein YphA (DoxX/SURF4 family)